MRRSVVISAAVAVGVTIGARAQTERCSWENPMDSTCSREEREAAGKRFSDKHQNWHYVERPVQMALVYSTNTAFFGPLEFQIERRVSLSVSQAKGFEMVAVSPGGTLFPAKLACRDVDCPLAVRFDQGPLKTYATQNRNGVSMSVVDTKDFLKNMRASQRLTVVFPLLEYGDLPFLFDISNYKW